MIVWKGDRLVELRRLATETNLSAQDIGNRLGASRNAIIGACARNNIPLPLMHGSRVTLKRAPRLPGERPKKPRTNVSLTRKPPKFIAQLPPVEVPSLKITFADIGDRQCRAITEGEGYQALFCGHKTAEGSSWCGWHQSRFFYTQEPKRKSTPMREAA